MVRVMVHNVQGLPVNVQHEKHELLKQDIKLWEADIVGITEVNLNLHKLPQQQQWKERFRGWTKHHCSVHTNQHSPSLAARLFGGTATMTIGKLANSVLDFGHDHHKLGRWTWVQLRGKRNTSIRIVTGYRPVSDNSDSPFSVHAQHELYFAANDDDTPPRQAFLRDLQQLITPWLEAGDQIIIMLDANEDVRRGEVHRFMDDNNLVDCHRRQHPTLVPVATCDKNRSEIPIDAIWCTPGLEAVKAGYLAFRQGQTASDHRLLWIDIPHEIMFGQTRNTGITTPTRRLSIKDPRSIKRYNTFLAQQYEVHQVHTKLYGIQTRAEANSRLSTADQQLYESLAHQDHLLRKAADRKCRKLRMGAHPYSPRLAKAQAAIQLWSLLITYRKGGKASHTKIRRLGRILEEPNTYNRSLPQLLTALKQAKKHYHKVKKKAGAYREKFLVSLAEAQATHRNLSTHVVQKQNQHVAQQRLMAIRTRETTGPRVKTVGFSMLDAPDLQGGRQTCTTKADIEVACAAEGQRRYSQTEGTPFVTNQSLLASVGLDGTGPDAEAILAGSYTVDESVDAFTSKFLTQLQRPENIQPINLWLSTIEHCNGWQKMRATTQSHPGSPALLDYIAGTHDELIANVDATFATIPLLAGYSPKWWAKATDVMIPKKANSLQVEKLRIIVLFNALFNMVNKRLGREMIHNAELGLHIPWEAYGSRRHHRAADCALNKVLTMDLTRLSRTPTILCSNDAKSCYDRIVHSVASLSMQRFGVDPKVCKVIFGTLQQMQHTVRTVFGDSESTYGCIALDAPLQGILQGNGAGPASGW